MLASTRPFTTNDSSGSAPVNSVLLSTLTDETGESAANTVVTPASISRSAGTRSACAAPAPATPSTSAVAMRTDQRLREGSASQMAAATNSAAANNHQNDSRMPNSGRNRKPAQSAPSVEPTALLKYMRPMAAVVSVDAAATRRINRVKTTPDVSVARANKHVDPINASPTYDEKLDGGLRLRGPNRMSPAPAQVCAASIPHAMQSTSRAMPQPIARRVGVDLGHHAAPSAPPSAVPARNTANATANA